MKFHQSNNFQIHQWPLLENEYKNQFFEIKIRNIMTLKNIRLVL